MGGRYWISGVQLGMLKAFAELKEVSPAKDLLDSIDNNQFLGNIEEEDRQYQEVIIFDKRNLIS